MNEINNIDIAYHPSKTFFYNKKTGKLEGMVDGLAAVVQTAETILSIERYRYQILPTIVGVETDDLIGERYSLVCSELRRTIEESLSIDDRITGVDSFEFEKEEDAAIVMFIMHTVYGSTPMKKGFIIDA